ncbi:flagellar filament capping protein FliD [Paraglaciecola polaris]|uniref:Flagellar hook-associated protein 2 n=1 Tax=Paraglaciecola polaris LMG 21857 TaxID=1129793 RepID=K6ZEB4_9ALTE|nr:flagellar filament capping protein FliD [Paraglaciecola polaris]GAC34401.1 flagellar hook-associated protein 2 [Paraglaciecola polaris LMG 21857]|tara:strand:+ start:2690 stop:4147 length:1458 start_codon:yes stop_codon:yes gene_type:complete
MSIQSLGVGSGLDLESLVGQLLEAERAPKQARLDKKEESYDAEISGLGKLKSKMKDFLDSVDELRSDSNLQGREPTIKNPSESIEPFTAEASNSAVEGDYEVAITQLASGSRIESNDAVNGGFSATSDTVLTAGAGSLTFKVDSTSDSFSINVTAGMTLQQLSSAINASEDNFGVKASIIDTGTADGGAKLVYTSTVTGADNDLIVVNDNDLAELNRVTTTNSAQSLDYLTPVKSAQNAKATIDGIKVESTSNVFENVIENVSFKASKISELADDGVTSLSSTLTIGFDSEGLETKIRDFVDDYNALNSEISTLTRYGQSELEDDGAFAGDYMIRSIQQGMSNIISSAVSTSALGGLFKLGIEFNDDGDLEIGSSDKFGFGSGEDRLKDALEGNFDDISSLFSDADEGVATRLYSYVEQYTNFSGLLTSREKSVTDQKNQLITEREQFELRMASTEQILRDKYLNLDQTVSKLNSTGSALLASLG